VHSSYYFSEFSQIGWELAHGVLNTPQCCQCQDKISSQPGTASSCGGEDTNLRLFLSMTLLLLLPIVLTTHG
jgi:hypothetical protein